MSIPDIDKIMKLSRLFGVSTDYLLKDEIEAQTPSEDSARDEEEGIAVDMETATAYMALTAQSAVPMAAAISAMILSPIPLVILGALSEYKHLLSEDMAGAVGVSVLLVVIVIGVVVLILNGMKLNKYEYLQKETFTLQYGVKGIVEKKKDAYETTYRTSIAIGVALCILGVIPLVLFGGGTGDDFVASCMTCVLLAFVSIGVNFFVRAGMVWDSYETLLQAGDYSPENKYADRKLEFFPGVYWCTVTALYLYVSFCHFSWGISWVIWPVAGVLFAAIMGILKVFVTRNHK